MQCIHYYQGGFLPLYYIFEKCQFIHYYQLLQLNCIFEKSQCIDYQGGLLARPERDRILKKLHGNLLWDCREPPEQDSGCDHHKGEIFLAVLTFLTNFCSPVPTIQHALGVCREAGWKRRFWGIRHRLDRRDCRNPEVQLHLQVGRRWGLWVQEQGDWRMERAHGRTLIPGKYCWCPDLGQILINFM